MRATALCFAAVVAAACQAPASEPVGQRSEAIVNGVNENGYPAVLYLYNEAGVACTGSLVSERVVLTAKHCVADVPEDGWFAGTGPNGDDEWYEGSSVVMPAGPELDGEDIALITLRDAPPVEAVWLAREFDDWYSVGDELTLVGYGETEDGSSGRKKRTTSAIEIIGPEPDYYVADNEFGLRGDDTGADHGDSGGPVFDADGWQVGVMVRADGESWTICTRVDRWLDLIDGAIADAGNEPEPEPEPEPDPDPIEPDPGALGAACARGGDCASGLCDDGRCTSRCDVLEDDPCPNGFYCDERGSCGEGRCVEADAGSRRIGNECTRDDQCATLLCADPGDGSGARCATPCPAGGGRGCGDDFVCHATTDGCGACLRRDDAPGAFGTGCDADDDCASGLCHDPGPTGVCTTSCGGGSRCAPGFTCDGELCVPAGEDGGGVGDACTTKSDCATGMCGRSDGVGLCTKACESDDECGDGYHCASTNDGEGACWPDGDSGSVDRGGCSTTPGGDPRGFLLLLGTLGTLFFISSFGAPPRK